MSKANSNPFKRKKRLDVVRSNAIDEKDRKQKFSTRPTAGEKALAKTAWLSGLNNSEILKIGNCTPMTLDKWVTEWNSDRTSVLLNLRTKQLELDVTETQIAEHKVYIQNLENLKRQYETEFPKLQKCSDILENILEQLAEHEDFDSKDFKQVCSAVKAYADVKSHRASLQSSYITCVNTLNAETGLTAYHKAAGNKVNEVYKAEGRLEVARMRREEDLETSTELRKKDFFEV